MFFFIRITCRLDISYIDFFKEKFRLGHFIGLIGKVGSEYEKRKDIPSLQYENTSLRNLAFMLFSGFKDWIKSRRQSVVANKMIECYAEPSTSK